MPPGSTLRTARLLLACSALALPAVATGRTVGAPSAVAPDAVMPDVVGQPVDVADQMVRLAGLEPVNGVLFVAPRNWREEIRPRVVSVQVPPPGARVPAGEQVAAWTLVEADGERQVVEMPDLHGMAPEEAVTTLGRAGLVVMPAVLDAWRDRAPRRGERGPVIVDSYPRPGQSVYAGTSVFLVAERP